MEGVDGGCSTGTTIHAGIGVTLVEICKGCQTASDLAVTFLLKFRCVCVSGIYYGPAFETTLPPPDTHTFLGILDPVPILATDKYDDRSVSLFPIKAIYQPVE